MAVMLLTVYMVWALLLFRSARPPPAGRLFLDFNLTFHSHRELRKLRRHAHHGRRHARPAPEPGGSAHDWIAQHSPTGDVPGTGPALHRPVIVGNTQVGMVEWVSLNQPPRQGSEVPR